jgi:hypothetical protein
VICTKGDTSVRHRLLGINAREGQHRVTFMHECSCGGSDHSQGATAVVAAAIVDDPNGVDGSASSNLLS